MNSISLGTTERRVSKSCAAGAAAAVVSLTLLGVASRHGGTSELRRLGEASVAGEPGSPLAKRVVDNMCNKIATHAAWDDWPAWSAQMEPFWMKDMIYDFSYVGDWNFGPTQGLHAWFEGEHMHFNKAIPDCHWSNFLLAGTNSTATSATYGMGRWVSDFAGVPPPASKPWVHIRDLDFYILEGDRIKMNWCMVDIVDLLQQAGYEVLPPAPMPTDGFGYLPPHAEDGLPAPVNELVSPEQTAESEAVWRDALHEDYLDPNSSASLWSDSMVWYGPSGIGTAMSRAAYREHFLKPFHEAFSNLTMQLDTVVCEGAYCGAHFFVYGDHTGPWLGEAAAGRRVAVRCGAHGRIVDGRIVEGWNIIDLPFAFHTMGVDLFARAKAQAELLQA